MQIIQKTHFRRLFFLIFASLIAGIILIEAFLRSFSTYWLRRHSLFADQVYRKIKLWRWIKKHGEDRFQWAFLQNSIDWAHDRDAFFQLVSLARYDWGAGWVKDSWELIDKELGRLKFLSEKHDFGVVVVAFPVSFQVFSTFLEDTPQRILQEKVQNLGFFYFDLLPFLRLHRDKDLYFDQCHPKKEANDLIGQVLADFLKKEVLPDRMR